MSEQTLTIQLTREACQQLMTRMDKMLSATAGDGNDQVYEVELIGSMVGQDDQGEPWFPITGVTEVIEDGNLDEKPDKERAVRGVRCALQPIRV